jgi:hypothetical protein
MAAIISQAAFAETDAEQSKTIQDPLLRQALRVVRAIKSRSKKYVSVDIHSSNIMWRLAGTMPQLVLTDPLY